MEGGPHLCLQKQTPPEHSLPVSGSNKPGADSMLPSQQDCADNGNNTRKTPPAVLQSFRKNKDRGPPPQIQPRQPIGFHKKP